MLQLQRRPSALSDWLHVAIVVALGLYFVIGGIAWAVFVYNGVPVPDAFTTLLATIAGGLVGVLAPAGGPARPPSPGSSGHPPSDSRSNPFSSPSAGVGAGTTPGLEPSVHDGYRP
jgi:hypothetical protein